MLRLAKLARALQALSRYGGAYRRMPFLQGMHWVGTIDPSVVQNQKSLGTVYSISPLNASHPSMHPLRSIRTSQLNNFWIYSFNFETSSSDCREKQVLFFYINIVTNKIIKDVLYVLFSTNYYILTHNIILKSSIARKIGTLVELTFLYNLSYLSWKLDLERESYSTEELSGCIEGWNALRGDIE